MLYVECKTRVLTFNLPRGFGTNITSCFHVCQEQIPVPQTNEQSSEGLITPQNLCFSRKFKNCISTNQRDTKHPERPVAHASHGTTVWIVALKSIADSKMTQRAVKKGLLFPCKASVTRFQKGLGAKNWKMELSTKYLLFFFFLLLF